MGVRQVQVTLRRGGGDGKPSPLRHRSAVDVSGNTPSSDSVEVLVELTMDLLHNLRGEFCIMPLVVKGESHILIQFRSQQKHLEGTVLALQAIGVGVDDGTRIDINELQVSIPLSKRHPKKKKRYKFSDRMTTEEIFESIDSGSHLTFDYLAMVFVASLIAAVGLLTDSSVSVVASMLVSPLMGPILGVTWGITMHDWDLIRRGARNEFVGVVVCFAVGMLVGLAVGPFFGPANLTVDWATGNLTSVEISSRGSPWSLLSGGVMAIPSGIGVALALTGGGISALVGVAISAALLPPIVNSGLCLSLAFWFDGDPDDYDTQGEEYYQYALWSFLLFVVNFVLIIVLALGVFKLKKLNPQAKREGKALWKRRGSMIGNGTNMKGKLLPGRCTSSSDVEIEREDADASAQAAQAAPVHLPASMMDTPRGDIEMETQEGIAHRKGASFNPDGPWGSKA